MRFSQTEHIHVVSIQVKNQKFTGPPSPLPAFHSPSLTPKGNYYSNSIS